MQLVAGANHIVRMSGDKVNLLLSERFPTTGNRVEKHRNIYGGSQSALNYYEVVKARLVCADTRPKRHTYVQMLFNSQRKFRNDRSFGMDGEAELISIAHRC